jgi:hypothetical protein
LTNAARAALRAEEAFAKIALDPVFHLVIVTRANTVPGEFPNLAIAAEQWTYLMVESEDPKFVKQKIWIQDPGARHDERQGYLIQEIYGYTETSGDAFSPASAAEDAQQQQPECIVCFVEPKDTIVLPCRHLCLCKVPTSCFYF